VLEAAAGGKARSMLAQHAPAAPFTCGSLQGGQPLLTIMALESDVKFSRTKTSIMRLPGALSMCDSESIRLKQKLAADRSVGM
jgi:hypothetical protein